MNSGGLHLWSDSLPFVFVEQVTQHRKGDDSAALGGNSIRPPAVNQASLLHDNEAVGAGIYENLLPQRWPN